MLYSVFFDLKKASLRPCFKLSNFWNLYVHFIRIIHNFIIDKLSFIMLMNYLYSGLLKNIFRKNCIKRYIIAWTIDKIIQYICFMLLTFFFRLLTNTFKVGLFKILILNASLWTSIKHFVSSTKTDLVEQFSLFLSQNLSPSAHITWRNCFLILHPYYSTVKQC